MSDAATDAMGLSDNQTLPSGRPAVPPWIPRNSKGMPYNPDLDRGAGQIDPAVVKGFEEANARPTSAPPVSDTDTGKPFSPAATEPSASPASEYVQRTMALEGSGKDPRSTAIGGFLEGTWLSLARENLPETRGMTDQQVLALRSDPVLRAKMTEVYARKNAGPLVQAGFQPNNSNLRLAHWFGADGARRVLTADPSTPLDKIFPPIVFEQNPTLTGKTAGDVLKIVDQQMSGTTLSQSMMRTLSPEVRAMMEDMQQRGERDHAENLKIIQQYEREAAAAPPGSKERLAAIEQMRKDSHRLMERWEDMTKHPPVEKPVDMWANFGSAASIVAMLGGLFARRHLTAALSAAGTAMEAINTNNHDRFLQSYKTWEQQTNLGLKMVELQNQEIRALLDDEKIAQDEKRARLSTLFQEYGMIHQDQSLRQSNDLRLVEMVNANERAAFAAKNQAELIKTQVYSSVLAQNLAKGMPEAEAKADAARKAGIVSASTAPTQAKGREEALQKAVAADLEKYKIDHPDATKAELDAETYRSRLLHEKEMGAATRQPRSAPAMQLQQFIEEHIAQTGKPPTATEMQQFSAQGTEQTARGRTIGTRSAALELASNAAEALMPLVKQTSDKINRTEFPTINSMVVAAQKGTGNTDVVRFLEMINSLKYLYARALSPTGQARVADLANFEKIVSENWTKGQIDAALDQIHQSLGVEKAAISKTRQEFREGGPAPATTPSPAIQSAPTIKYDSQGNRLP